MAIPVKLRRPKVSRIHKPEAIDFLFDTNTSAWLAPFMVEPRTLKEAANHRGVTISAYSYWIKKLLRFGLLNVVYSEARQGTAMKYYWSVADRFEFALSEDIIRKIYSVVADEYKEKLLSNFERNLQTEIHSLSASLSIDVQEDFVFEIYRQGKPVKMWQELLEPNAPALFLSFGNAQLSFEDAKALQKEMFDLMEKYKAKLNPKEKRYLVQVGLGRLD